MDWTKNPAIRNLPYPPDGQRVETGVVRFGEDWPAIHIRGDNAIVLANALAAVLNHHSDPIAWAYARNLHALLVSCSVAELKKEAIDRGTS